MSRLLVVTLLAATLLIGGPAGAAQEPICSEVLVDAAGVLDGAGQETVRAAADRLGRRGAHVRVRTVDHVPDANLDRYQARMQRRCPGWQSADGGRKNNLLVVIVAVGDRQTGLYYGAEWEQALDGEWLDIQARAMNPRFRDGEFAEGLAGGLTAIGRRLEPPAARPDAPAPVAPARPDVPAPGVPAPVAPPGVTPDDEGPLGALNRTLVLSVIVGAAVLWLIVVLVGKARRRRAELRAARGAALQSKQAAAAQFLRLEADAPAVLLAADAMIEHLGPVHAAGLTATGHTARQAVEEANEAFSTAAQGPDPDDALALERAHQAQRAFAAAATALQTASVALGQLQEETSHLEALRATLPAAFEQAEQVVRDVEAAAQRVEAAGYRADGGRQRGVAASTTLATGRDAYAQRDYLAAAEHLGRGQDEATAAVTYLDELPASVADLRERQAMAQRRGHELRDRIAQGRAVFDRVAEQFAESTWRSIQGNGTEAERLHTTATEATGQAAALLADDRQDWDGAAALLEQSALAFDQVETLIAAVVALEQSLVEEQRSVAGDIAAAQRDVDAARDFLTSHDPDIDDALNPEPGRAQTLLDAARAELEQAKPDYFAVARLAREADELADRVLAQARSEHELAERRRAEAEQWLRAAAAAVARADGYISARRWTVRSGAERLRDEAVTMLTTAQADTDIDSRIHWAREAHATAEAAYEEARDDVEDARRRRHSMAFGAGAGMGSSFGGGGGGGGGGFGGGGFGGGGGGGGSSSFGGSGGGGGGSSGW